jgi:hypothetical protein
MIDYKVRPGFGSRELLIELTPISANQEFWDQLLNGLQSIGANILGVENLWFNDEVLLSCSSNFGDFIISADVWDIVFIMAPENQSVIQKIDEALQSFPGFRKLPVDPDTYS